MATTAAAAQKRTREKCMLMLFSNPADFLPLYPQSEERSDSLTFPVSPIPHRRECMPKWEIQIVPYSGKPPFGGWSVLTTGLTCFHVSSIRSLSSFSPLSHLYFVLCQEWKLWWVCDCSVLCLRFVNRCEWSISDLCTSVMIYCPTVLESSQQNRRSCLSRTRFGQYPWRQGYAKE